MKFVSALILVCAFACASAQFGVKGGSSGSSSRVRGPFFPRFTPGSIQEKKEQLQVANVDEVDDGSSSVVVGGSGAAGSAGNTRGGFVQPVGQQENIVQTFVQERPTQQVLVPSSGSVSSLPSLPSLPSVGSVPVVERTVSPVQQQTFSFVPPFQPVLPTPTFGNVAQFGQFAGGQVVQPAVQTVQTVQPTVQTVQTVQPAVQTIQTVQPVVQSVPSVVAPVTKTVQPSNRFFFDNRQPAQFVRFGPANSGPVTPFSFPNVLQFNPSVQPQVATVQNVPVFATNEFGSRAVKQVVRQFNPTFVSQPAPVQLFPGSRFAPVPAVPQVPAGFAVPSVSSGALPVASFQAVAPTVSGKVFTDNKISAPQGFTNFQPQQQLPSVISQEKQSTETVQTTEW